MTEKTCADRIQDYWGGVKNDLTRYANDGEVYENGHEDGACPFHEYALCFDYVAPKTFTDQREGYWRYQMSWGGPSDEIRFFGGSNGTYYRAEYWFLDWGDGAKLQVTNEGCIEWLWDQLVDLGAVRNAYDKEMADVDDWNNREED